MYITCLVNLKGGSGKTTTAFQLAGAFAEQGKSVLVIDLDPQRTISQNLLGVQPQDPPLSRILIEGKSIAPLISRSHLDGIAVVPADQGLRSIQAGLSGEVGIELRLARALSELEGFHYCFIDCPPALDRLTLNGLIAAHYAIVPVDPGALGRETLGVTLQYIEQTRRWHNPALEVLGLLIANVRLHTVYHQQVTHLLRKTYGHLLFDTIIPSTIRIAESAERQLPLVFLPPYLYGQYAALYRKLAREIETRITRRR